MKRIISLALVVLASASFCPMMAGNKKDKKQKNKTEAVATVLNGEADSLSYAMGMNSTQGLIPYLQGNFGVDTAYMADFIKGYQAAIERANTPAGKAYIAGEQIAKTVSERFIPGASKEIGITGNTLNEKLFNQGFVEALAKHSVLADSVATAYFKEKIDEANQSWKAENAEWLKANKSKEGVKTMASGLQYRVISEGTGSKPLPTDEVEVVYEGKDIKGNIFDSTTKHGTQSDKFRANQVIKGWTEALTNMTVGSKWEVFIPQELAYGSRAAGTIRPYSTLIFTIELKNIVTKHEPKAEAKADAKASTKAEAKANTAKTASKGTKKAAASATKKKAK